MRILLAIVAFCTAAFSAVRIARILADTDTKGASDVVERLLLPSQFVTNDVLILLMSFWALAWAVEPWMAAERRAAKS